jgi:glycosyltransferase involved in cell wall biosynthesis
MSRDAEPVVDLIVATVGRTAELVRLLDSLEAQSYERFRVIVVDQNDDDRLEGIVAPYASRNVGLRHIQGDFVAFPDDDCWYPSDLLENVVAGLMARPEWSAMCVSARDASGHRSSMLWDRAPGAIDRFNIWRRAISFTIFLRSSVTYTVGSFAEDLGVGSGTEWQAGEESDYLLRALAAGFEVYYDPSLFVCHESPSPALSREASRRAFLNGVGHGRVLRRHGYPLWFMVARVAQLVAGSVVLLITARPAKARFYFAMAVGRARGWLTSNSGS